MTGFEPLLDGLGVPPRKASGSRFPLQLRARITGLAGFPLQSLTRNSDPGYIEALAPGREAHADIIDAPC